jgi:hypothetical protein
MGEALFLFSCYLARVRASMLKFSFFSYIYLFLKSSLTHPGPYRYKPAWIALSWGLSVHPICFVCWLKCDIIMGQNKASSTTFLVGCENVFIYVGKYPQKSFLARLDMLVHISGSVVPPHLKPILCLIACVPVKKLFQSKMIC